MAKEAGVRGSATLKAVGVEVLQQHKVRREAFLAFGVTENRKSLKPSGVKSLAARVLSAGNKRKPAK